MQSIYFRDSETENARGYYSIGHTRTKCTLADHGNESSAVNRAVTFYAYLVEFLPAGNRQVAR
jgi:hypothetical protein